MSAGVGAPQQRRRASKATAKRAEDPSSVLITFSEFPVGTTITNQYEDDGIIFECGTPGDAQFITEDGANPNSPELSGTPLFTGPVCGTFVVPGTTTPTTVNSFSLEAGYIDDPGSTVVNVYGLKGNLIDTVAADQYGFNEITVSVPGIARFEVVSLSLEEAGFGVDNVFFEPSAYTIEGSIPVPSSTPQSGDQATGSPALAMQCQSHKAKYLLAQATVDSALAGFVLFPTAKELLSHFLEGSGTAIAYPDGSTVSEEVEEGTAFKERDKKVEEYAAQQARKGAGPSINVRHAMRTIELGNSIADNLYWAFRGTQGLDISGSFHRDGDEFVGTVTYVIRDIYGFGNNEKFGPWGKAAHYLQSVCGAPYYPGGAHFFPDSITVTVPFKQAAT